jgi:ubiquinone/menaquinone biosynthesis C-methylase UbiE
MRASMSRSRAHPGRRLRHWPAGRKAGAAFAGAQVVGVDLSTGMIRRAAAARAGSGAGFVAGYAEELPFAGAVFGLVVVTLSMSH